MLFTELAAKANKAKVKKIFEQIALKKYHKYSKVFSEVNSHCFFFSTNFGTMQLILSQMLQKHLSQNFT
jgi:hypothetical protein